VPTVFTEYCVQQEYAGYSDAYDSDAGIGTGSFPQDAMHNERYRSGATQAQRDADVAVVGMENMAKKLDVVEKVNMAAKVAIKKISELADMENKMDNSKNLSTTVPEQYGGVVVTSILQYGKSR
jgi:hypothetical protein